MAPHPCAHCGELVPKGQRCPTCKAARADRGAGSTTARGYGAAWQKRSARILRRDGYQCQLRLTGCKGLATTTDHVVPKSAGGTDADSNLVAACRPCNSKKRARLVMVD